MMPGLNPFCLFFVQSTWAGALGPAHDPRRFRRTESRLTAAAACTRLVLFEKLAWHRIPLRRCTSGGGFSNKEQPRTTYDQMRLKCSEGSVVWLQMNIRLKLDQAKPLV